MRMELNHKDAQKFFLLCWVAYCCTYFGRQNYSATMNELIGTAVTKQEAGWISTGFFVSYAFGQLVNGLLAEKKSAYGMSLIGLVGAGIFNLLFPLGECFFVLLGLRVATGYCMSMIWPSLFRCMVQHMCHEDVVKSSVQIASSTVAGTIGSYLISSALLRFSGWKAAFIFPGILLLACAFAWKIEYKALTSRATAASEISYIEKKKKKKALPAFQLLLIPSILFAIVPTVFHGAIKDGVTSWVPTYICEVFSCETSFSVLVSAILPVVNLTGAYAAKVAYRKFNENIFHSSCIFFGLASICLVLMMTVGQRSMWLTLLLFALITSSMLAVNVLLINLFPLEFEKDGRAATVTGGLNAIAYVGSALTSGLIGVMTESNGWQSAILSWLIMMALAFAICIVAGKRRESHEKIVCR